MLKAVLFDVDDTLFDRNTAQLVCFNRMLEQFISLFRGLDRDTLWKAWQEADRIGVTEFNAGSFDRASRSRHFLRLISLPQDSSSDLTEFYLQEYPTIFAPLPGSLELIHDLAGQCLIGVISNSYPDVQYGKIKTLGLTGLLSCIVLSEEIGVRKPDPGIFKHAAQGLGIPPSHCLYVGDSLSSDILGAQNAGLLAEHRQLSFD
jgi:putative hydrolase of the HAD superfamily